MCIRDSCSSAAVRPGRCRYKWRSPRGTGWRSHHKPPRRYFPAAGESPLSLIHIVKQNQNPALPAKPPFSVVLDMRAFSESIQKHQICDFHRYLPIRTPFTDRSDQILRSLNISVYSLRRCIKNVKGPLLFSQLCAFTAQTVRKRIARKRCV